MALRHHKKKIIKDHDGDGDDGITIHYMNRNQLADAFQKSTVLSQPERILASQNKEQKELIATLQKSLEDKTKELKISQASSQEANEHRALCAAQVIQLEKDKNALELDITALEDSHKSEVEALQQETKAAEKKATDELEESRASYTQMKQGLEQQIYELQQQNENLRESTWCDIKVANESITSLQQSNQKLQLSNNTLGQSIKQYSRAYGTLQQSNKKLQQSYGTLQRSFQEQAVEMKAKADAHDQLSLEHKKLEETLESATEVIEPLTSKVHELEQQCKEQQESSAAKYDKLQKEYELLEDDNKVKSDEVQSLKAEAVDVKKKIKTEMKVLQEKHQSISHDYESQLTTLNNSVASLRKEKQAKELKIEEIVSANNGLSNLYDAQKKENETLQSKVNLLGISLEEMKSNEKKLIRLHKSEIETSSQQYEKQVTTLNHLLKQSVTTLQQAKKDKESETVKLSQQHEAQLAKLRDSVATIQQEKQEKDLVLFSYESETENHKKENEVLQSRVKSLELNVEEIKTSKEKLIHLHNSEKSSLLQKHETQLSTLNNLIGTHQTEKIANELEIEKLTISNAELSTLNDEQGKDNEALKSTVTSLEQSVKALKTKEEELIRSHKEEVAIQNETAERMKVQVKDLTEENQSQVKINTSLQSQLDGASNHKSALQERINLLEMKLQKATSSSSNNDSSKTTSRDDIAKVKSSKGDEGSVVVKTKASKAEPTTATLDEVLQDKKEDQKTSLKSAQANTTPRSSLSNALSDIGNRQSVSSTNSATTKLKKATDLKSQASTANSSKKDSVSQLQPPRDENNTVTCPATSELCSDHFTKERNEVQNEARSSVSSTSSSEGSSDSTLVPWNEGGSSSCVPSNANQGCGGVPRRKKRESFEDYNNRKKKNNNHQVSEAKAKEVGTKPEAYEQDKTDGVDVDKEVKKSPEKEGDTKSDDNEQDKPADGIDVGKDDKEDKKTPKTEELSPISQKGSKRRKRKATASSNEVRTRKKSTVENKANVANSGDVKDKEIDSAGIKCGEVGYKFKKWFSGYNDWYDGEVVDFVKINNRLLRRCQYADKTVEDYTITEMKNNCKPR